MKKRHIPLILVAAVSLSGWFLVQAADTSAKPLRVLLMAGGCCHDYAMQTKLLKAGIESRVNATVDIDYNEDKSTKATFERYASADWAKGYDVVIHDECTADVTDPAYVKRILDAHRDGVPAVNLHCGMHSYRWGNIREPIKPDADNGGWYEMLGLHSTGHGPQEPIDIIYTDAEHPITKGLANWTTIKEELYNNIEVYPSARPLAKGVQIVKPKPKQGEPADPNAKGQPVEAVVAWTNEYGPKKTRIFGTTIGHNNETVADDRYLDLVSRGLLWSVGKIEADGKPSAGFGK